MRKVSAGATHYYHYNGSDIWAEYSAWSKADAPYTQGPASDDPLIRLTITATNTFGAGKRITTTATAWAVLWR